MVALLHNLSSSFASVMLICPWYRFYLVPADNNKSSRDLCEEKLAEWEVESLGFLYTHHQGNHAIVFENHNFYDWQNDEEFADDPENPMALLCVDPPK